MKFKIVVLAVSFLASILAPAIAKNKRNESPSLAISNYVVIGAFAVYKNATRFTVRANHQSEQLRLTASYDLNPNRNLYYVFVLSTQDQDEAMRLANRLRAETQFTDAWVYHGVLGSQTQEEAAAYKGNDINPSTEGIIETVQPVDLSKTTEKSSSIENTGVATDVNAEKSAVAGKAKYFIFKLFRAVDNSEIKGDVEAIDVDRSRKIGTYDSNMPVRVYSPRSKSGELALVCKVFGYRKVQHNLDYNKPVDSEVTVNDDSTIVVPFELVRLQKGDIAAMYNVYFYNDAGIMRPESRFEVNSLLEMMKENPNYKIKIHGHTNGAAVGKILSLGDKKDFFSLTGTKESIGSSKKLSEERARVVKEYLVANGIDGDRMKIKAWGGKRPIYDKNSVKAKENVRVEIEIMDN